MTLCFEQFHAALGSALWAHQRSDNALKSQSLTRALSALTALQLGVDAQAPLGPELLRLYQAARASLLDCVLKFDPRAVARVRSDFADIAGALNDA